MRAVVQRVTSSSVEANGETNGIGGGLNILLGIKKGDTIEDARYIAEKAAGLRIFPDEYGKMNLSADNRKHEILLISQFTLYGDARNGRRPSFVEAAEYEEGRQLYEAVRDMFIEMGFPTKTGFYGAEMKVTIVNDGPVTILLDSGKSF